MQTRFRQQCPLGVGPDGVVHQAVAERLGARPVALRRLDIPAGAARRTLRTDAETIASLGHPGLAVVDDIVEVDDETVLVATTLGTEGTLADRLLLGSLSVDDAVEVVRTVADAIGSAHRLGLTHGRLTPTNVLLTASGPVVCDLVQAGAQGRSRSDEDPEARDANDLIRLASALVDGNDRSPRAAAYRSLCRWSTESGAGLDGFIAALERLERLEEPRSEPAPDVPVSAVTPSDQGSVGLVVSAALAIGSLLGAAATLLPTIR